MKGCCNQFTPVLTRREMLRQSAAGFGSLALASLLNEQQADAGPLAYGRFIAGSRAIRVRATGR